MSTSLRRVLLLSYYFPPHGGAGVQRTVKFVKYLPGLGYEPVVVAGPAGTAPAWAPADPALGAELPTDVQILRIEEPEPPQAGRWRSRTRRHLHLRSPFAWWLEDGLASTGAAVADRVDLIYASMSPWETGDAARALATRVGVPWVADLRDPWALDEWAVYPTGVHRRLELERMRRLLDSATAIVMNTPGSGEAVRRRWPALADRVRVIPNGYDAADFAGPAAQPDPRVFRIVFSGYAHTSYGRSYRRFGAVRSRLGGAARGLDPLSRSHVFLLDAVAEVLARRPDLAEVLEVHLAGVGSDDHAHELSSVIAHGYVPHTRAVELVRTADLLFLPLHDLASGVLNLTVPAKSYEYLASGRPILAAIPAGDTRDLLSSAPSVTCCGPKDVDGIARSIESAVDAWRGHGTHDVDRSAFMAPYERRELSRRLAGVFDEVIRGPDR